MDIISGTSAGGINGVLAGAAKSGASAEFALRPSSAAVRVEPGETDGVGGFRFTITLTNRSQKTLRIPDTGVYYGQMLFMRRPDGSIAKPQELVDYRRPMPRRIELEPGGSKDFGIDARVGDASGRGGFVSESSRLVLESHDILWDLRRPGRFEAIVLYEQPTPPDGEGADDAEARWTGRAVSRPAAFEVTPPAAAATRPADQHEDRGTVADEE